MRNEKIYIFLLYLLWIGTLCGGNNSSEANQIKVDGIKKCTLSKFKQKLKKIVPKVKRQELIKYSFS